MCIFTFKQTKSDEIRTPVVNTKYGKLRGVYQTVPGIGVSVAKYLGVPYATAPVSSNRFSPTRTLQSWTGIHEANKFQPACPQKLPDVSNLTKALMSMSLARVRTLKRYLPVLKKQSEDCLYLNLYVPQAGK